jgi:plastocyanin
MKEFRERVLMPLLVPLVALAVIVVVVLNISRILLALEERSGPHTVVIIALIIAAAVLFCFTYASSRSEERSTSAMSLLSVAGILVVIAGFIGYEAMAETQGEEAAKKKAAAGVAKPDITVEAFDIGFKVKDFKIGPGNVVIQEVNTGATAHTFILEGVSSGRKLSVPSGGAKDQATFGLQPGTYTFYCDIPGHRQAGMEGKIEVNPSFPAPGAGGAAGGGGAAAGTPFKITAADLSFTPKEQTLKAGPIAVSYQNTGAIQHTLLIDGDGTFKKLVADPGKLLDETWNAKPGTYTFYCDIPGHRQAGMETKVTVQ